MENNLSFKEIARTDRWDGRSLHIIDRGTNFEPFVVCWNFDGKEWDWGSYFSTIERARDVYCEKQIEYGFDEGSVEVISKDVNEVNDFTLIEQENIREPIDTSDTKAKPKQRNERGER